MPQHQMMTDPIEALRARLANLDERILHLRSMQQKQGDALAGKLIAHTEKERAEITAELRRAGG